jgi:hypothetical protein
MLLDSTTGLYHDKLIMCGLPSKYEALSSNPRTAKKVKMHSKKRKESALVAHACNPSYSGGRDQEDLGSKPAQANSS